MLTQIPRPAAKPIASDDPIALLEACHRRIRQFTATAGALATGATATPAEVAEAAASVARYFSVALPLHSTDEELSVRPRLLAARPPTETAEALEAMGTEHGELHALLATMLPRWEDLAREPGLRESLAPSLARDTTRLDALWRPHLGMEETVIFPAMRAHLGSDSLGEILAEMRARRAQ